MGPRRSFYEEDDLVIAKPGFNSESLSPELIKKESPTPENMSFVNGMTIRTIPILEEYLNQSRIFLYNKLTLYSAELDTQKSALSNELRSIQSSFNSVVVEPILPNLIYILTGALSGSVLVNNKSLPVRFITPVLFGTVVYSQLMPNSFKNTASSIYEVEKHYPQLISFQNDSINQVKHFEKCVDNALTKGNTELQNSIHSMRVYLKNLFD